MFATGSPPCVQNILAEAQDGLATPLHQDLHKTNVIKVLEKIDIGRPDATFFADREHTLRKRPPPNSDGDVLPLSSCRDGVNFVEMRKSGLLAVALALQVDEGLSSSLLVAL
uniref:Uncharacterized protein n=1 Tax=Romanomermis culicivorax TaxID=13658 RepID=A0A915HM51_ROMCU